MPKKTYHHGDLRRALVAAARQILATDGLPALTLRRVAREAGVTHGAPYAHFRDLNDLLAAIKDQGFEQLLAALRKTQEETAGLPPAAQLEKLALSYLKFARDHGAMFQLLFHTPLPPGSERGHTYVETGRQLFSLGLAVVGAAGAEPADRTEAVARRALVGWSALHGACSLWAGGSMPYVTTHKSLLPVVKGIVQQVLADAGVRPAVAATGRRPARRG